MRESHQTYSIRQVINLTGVSEYTLRAWELRYQAFTPRRTPTGRRCYFQEDLLKIWALKDLLQQGHRIGEIAPMPLDLLQQLLEATDSKSPVKTSPQVEKFVDSVFTQAVRHDWNWIQKELTKKRTHLPAERFILESVIPLTNEMASRVHLGTFSIGQEHILSALLKDQLTYLRLTTQPTKAKHKFVVTTPEGDIHELGIAIAASLILTAGFETLYLGPNTPASDLVDICVRYRPSHLLLSSVVSEKEGAKQSFYSYIEFLDRHLSPEVKLITGGRNATAVDLHSKRECLYLENLMALIEYLNEHC